MKNNYIVLCVIFFLLVLCVNASLTNYDRTDYIGGIVRVINKLPQKSDLIIVINEDGSIRHLEDDLTTFTVERKIAFITKTGLQLESLDETDIANANIYNRTWQIPENGSYYIVQYPLIYENYQFIPDFDNPSYYALSATSNTLISIAWIKDGFTPYPVPNIILED